jgi:hypothetical protein
MCRAEPRNPIYSQRSLIQGHSKLLIIPPANKEESEKKKNIPVLLPACVITQLWVILCAFLTLNNDNLIIMILKQE